VTPGDFDMVMSPNVRAAFFAAQAVMRGMIEAGTAGTVLHV
jgi:NAD(P)-dependent dehydrogenase (short-subunit alcohol dehydrogenase family)